MNGVTLLSQHYKNYVNYIKNVAKSKMFTYIKHRHIARCAQGCQSAEDVVVDSDELFETSSWKLVYLSFSTSSFNLSSGATSLKYGVRRMIGLFPRTKEQFRIWSWDSILTAHNRYMIDLFAA